MDEFVSQKPCIERQIECRFELGCEKTNILFNAKTIGRNDAMEFIRVITPLCLCVLDSISLAGSSP